MGVVREFDQETPEGDQEERSSLETRRERVGDAKQRSHAD